MKIDWNKKRFSRLSIKDWITITLLLYVLVLMIFAYMALSIPNSPYFWSVFRVFALLPLVAVSYLILGEVTEKIMRFLIEYFYVHILHRSIDKLDRNFIEGIPALLLVNLMSRIVPLAILLLIVLLIYRAQIL